MKTVKQILGESQAIDYTDRLSVLSSLGLLEESKVGLVRRSLEKNPMSMTMAESKALKEFVDNILSQMLLEKQDYLSKFDKRVPKGYPSDRDMPTVLILKRKAIRVYPDNQKVALYYSQALDRYISIPFNGARGEPLGMVMNEETEQLNELYGMRRSEEKEAKRKEKIMRILAGMKTKEGQLDSEKISSFIKELPKTDLHLLPNKMKVSHVLPSDSHLDVAYMAGVAARRSLNNLFRGVAGRKKLPDQMQEPAKPEDAVKSKGPVQGPGTSYGMFESKNTFRKNLQQIREDRLNEADNWQDKTKAFGYGVARGVTFGGSDWVAKKLGGDPEKYEKENPTASSAGEWASLAIPGAAGLSAARGAVKGVQAAKKAAELLGKKAGAGALVKGALKGAGRSKGGRIVRAIGRGAKRALLGAGALAAGMGGENGDGNTGSRLFTPTDGDKIKFGGIDPKVTGPGNPVLGSVSSLEIQKQRWGTASNPNPGGIGAYESNLSIIRKLSRSKSLLEQKINFLDENDLTINRGAAKKIMKVYNSLNESNKGKMEKMLNESVVTFTQAINFAVRQ